MREANAQGAVGDDFRESEVRGLGVEIALDDLEVRGDGAEVVVGFLVGQVAETEDLGDFVGGEEFLELGVSPVRMGRPGWWEGGSGNFALDVLWRVYPIQVSWLIFGRRDSAYRCSVWYEEVT